MELPNRPTKDPYQEIPVKDFSYVNTKKGPSKRDKKSQIIFIISCCILLAILGAGAYSYGYYTRDNKKQEVKTTTKIVVKPLANNIYSPTTTSYDSTVFGFNIKYPDSWQLSSSGTNNVSLTSPVTSLTADTGQKVNGRVVLSVVSKGLVPAGFGTSSVAVLDSVDISFDSPTSNQAAQSYLSFVQYPATDIKGGLDGIYVTGNNGYVKDDVIPIADVNTMSPLIYATFYQCNSLACTSSKPLTISSSEWSNTDFSNAITNTIKSMTFM